jgi:hypothetical protein
MDLQQSNDSRTESPTIPVAFERRRVRTDAWQLRRIAARRRRRANLTFAASLLGVVVLFRALYFVLTR